MHRQIELALNGECYDRQLPEMDHFHTFVRCDLEARRWKLYRTEWSIYDEGVMVAGQIDAIFRDDSGGLHMVDWKRCRELLHPDDKASFGRYGLFPCDELIDNACSHYFLQQNLYAAILRRRYGIR